MAYYKTLEDASKALGFTPKGFENALYEPEVSTGGFEPAIAPQMGTGVPKEGTLQEATQAKSPLNYQLPGQSEMQVYDPNAKQDLGAPGGNYNQARLEDVAYKPPSYYEQLEQEAQAAKNRAYAEMYNSGWTPELLKAATDRHSGEAGNYMPMLDAKGNIIGAWNPKAGRYAEAPIAGARKAPATYEERAAMAGRNDMKRQLIELTKAARNNPDSLGPIQGRVDAWKREGYIPHQYIPDSLPGGKPLSPEVTDMHTWAQDLANMKVYDASGKAINMQEMVRLGFVLPKPTDPPQTFDSNMKNFLAQMRNKGLYLDPEGTQPLPTYEELIAEIDAEAGRGGQPSTQTPSVASAQDGWTIRNGVKIRKKVQ
jgi:hypothetical protein